MDFDYQLNAQTTFAANNITPPLNRRGTAVAQWLRSCVAIRKVADSILAGVSGFFIDIKSFRSPYGPGDRLSL